MFVKRGRMQGGYIFLFTFLPQGAGESFSPVKANPVPDFSSVFQPVLLHQHTDAKPFAFEGKYPSKDEVVEKLVRQEEEKVAKASR